MPRQAIHASHTTTHHQAEPAPHHILQATKREQEAEMLTQAITAAPLQAADKTQLQAEAHQSAAAPQAEAQVASAHHQSAEEADSQEAAQEEADSPEAAQEEDADNKHHC